MDRHADLHARIDRVCERANHGSVRDVVDEMNHLLSEGYARALLDEKRIVEIDERVVEALVSGDRRNAHQLRALTEERRTIARACERLRDRLAVIHDRYVALRAG